MWLVAVVVLETTPSYESCNINPYSVTQTISLTMTGCSHCWKLLVQVYAGLHSWLICFLSPFVRHCASPHPPFTSEFSPSPYLFVLLSLLPKTHNSTATSPAHSAQQESSCDTPQRTLFLGELHPHCILLCSHITETAEYNYSDHPHQSVWLDIVPVWSWRAAQCMVESGGWPFSDTFTQS